MDLNQHVYLGKPTTPGKLDEKPLLVPDFVMLIPDPANQKNRR